MLRLVLAGLVTATVLAATVASAPSHTPASNGWIAFASNRLGPGGLRFRLYRLEVVGGAVAPLGTLTGRAPAWSPDGSRIAFVDARLRLVVARADGTRAKVLTRRPIVAEQPAWSPDGSRIVFQHYIVGGGGGRDLSVIGSDGTGRRRLTRTAYDEMQPSWSPDGSLIAFASNRGTGRRTRDYEIDVVRPDGRGLRALTGNGIPDVSPAWSPDGRVIAFESGREPMRFNPELWTMRSDGTGERRVQPASGPSGFPTWADHGPSWSPDGNWLVYVSNETLYRDDVFIVRPDGEDKIDLTPGTHSEDVDPAWQPVCSHLGTVRSDRLRGTLADDRVCGFESNDTIRGGTGRDGLYGGDGDDELWSRDGSFDVVGCGAGRDEVHADRVDIVGADCERIKRR